MVSMYETIMELPLFKGIGSDQLSQMLEKTRVEFLNFEDGEVIAKTDEQVDSIGFLLSGHIRRLHKLSNIKITFEETLGKGAVIGAMNLYGLSNHYISDIQAVGKSSILKIGKSQYMNILRSDEIYLMNYLNYLSAAAQRRIKMASRDEGYSIGSYLKNIASLLLSPMAKDVRVKGSDEDLAALCGASETEFMVWKRSTALNEGFEFGDNQVILKKGDPEK